MILCVDIGNTNITLGIYDNEFIETVRIASDKELSEAQYELLIKTITKNYKEIVLHGEGRIRKWKQKVAKLLCI